MSSGTRQHVNKSVTWTSSLFFKTLFNINFKLFVILIKCISFNFYFRYAKIYCFNILLLFFHSSDSKRNLSGAGAFFRKIKTDSHNWPPFWLHVSCPLLHVGWVFSEKVTVSVITAGQYGFVACSEEDVLCGGRNSSSSSSGPGQQMGKAKKQQSGWETVHAQTYWLSATTKLAQHMTCSPSNATVLLSVFQWLTLFCRIRGYEKVEMTCSAG